VYERGRDLVGYREENLSGLFRIKTVMPYDTGQEPMVGDVVCGKFGGVGTVTHIFRYGASRAELVVKWKDGTIGIRYVAPEALMLIERRATAPKV
jgi:hypothetical protein